jgi:tetratricopeptide (TPR) repeat protein
MWRTAALLVVGFVLCSCSPAQQQAERGKTYSQAGDPDRAIQDLTRALELKPDDAEAYYRRAGLYAAKGDWDHAIADLSCAIELKPDNAQAYWRRGEISAGRRDWDSAVADFTRSLEIAPDDASALNDFAWLLATCAEDRVRDGKKALEHARRACELPKWQESNYLDTLAAAYAEAGQYAEATQWQQKALADPGFVDGYGNEAQARLALYEAGEPYRELRPAPPEARLADAGAPDLPRKLQHSVTEGETLQVIAEMYGTTVDAIKNENPTVKTDADLQPNLKLMVPYR